MFDVNERSISQILRSTQGDFTIAIYLRGGIKYSIRTNAVVELMTDIETNVIAMVDGSSGTGYCVKELYGDDHIRGASGIQSSRHVGLAHRNTLVPANSTEQNVALVVTEGATIHGTTELESVVVSDELTYKSQTLL